MGADVSIVDLKMDGCTDTPCPAKVGAAVSGELTLKSKDPIPETLACTVTGNLNGASIPFPGTPECKQKSKTDDGNFVYKLSLEVPAVAPKVSWFLTQSKSTKPN